RGAAGEEQPETRQVERAHRRHGDPQLSLRIQLPTIDRPGSGTLARSPAGAESGNGRSATTTITWCWAMGAGVSRPQSTGTLTSCCRGCPFIEWMIVWSSWMVRVLLENGG